MSKFLEKFFEDIKNSKFIPNRVMYIKGEYGVGKSFLTKTVLKNIDSYQKKSALTEVIISSLNPSSKSKLLNSFHIVLRDMFLSLA